MRTYLKLNIFSILACITIILAIENNSKAEVFIELSETYRAKIRNTYYDNYQLKRVFDDTTHKPKHHHQNPHHFMLMASVGTTDYMPDFYTVGLGYQYRLPFFNRLISPGIMGMLMFYPDYSHFMVMGTINFHPYKEWFIQTEYGMTHLKNQEGTHEMAPMFGVGLGHHFMLGNIAIAPIIIAEYSRLQYPAYSIGICLSYHKEGH